MQLSPKSAISLASVLASVALGACSSGESNTTSAAIDSVETLPTSATIAVMLSPVDPEASPSGGGLALFGDSGEAAGFVPTGALEQGMVSFDGEGVSFAGASEDLLLSDDLEEWPRSDDFVFHQYAYADTERQQVVNWFNNGFSDTPLGYTSFVSRVAGDGHTVVKVDGYAAVAATCAGRDYVVLGDEALAADDRYVRMFAELDPETAEPEALFTWESSEVPQEAARGYACDGDDVVYLNFTAEGGESEVETIGSFEVVHLEPDSQRPVMYGIEPTADLSIEGNEEFQRYLPIEVTGHDGRVYWYTEVGTVWSVSLQGEGARQEYDLEVQNLDDGNTNIRLRGSEVQMLQENEDGSFVVSRFDLATGDAIGDFIELRGLDVPEGQSVSDVLYMDR